MLRVILRSAVVYLVLLIGIRLLGKRQMGELELNELVIAMLLSDLASTPLQDLEMPLHYGIVSALTLLAMSLLLSWVCLKSLRFRTVFCGSPTVIIRDGQLMQRAMRRNRFTIDELLGELRVQGVMDLRCVKYAILETNGQLSLLLARGERPPTAAELGVQAQEESPSILLINDGQLLEGALKKAGLDQGWLRELLHRHGLSRPQEVFLLTVDRERRPLLIPRERRFTSPRGSCSTPP